MIVELRQVGREFRRGTTVRALNEVDLDLAAGDYLAITGPSGAGKSTMLNILGLLDRPTSGEYLFDGVATSGLDDRRRSALRGASIGFVFQSFHLLPGRTVLQNVMLAFVYGRVPRAERIDRATEALDRVGLTHRTDFHPGTLSGGERQRVAIARAVCTGPRLLLADEPTGNLDQANAESVMQLFDELNADGLTLVVITHDIAIAERARRRVGISDGRLTEFAR
ncbi:ABC transporter ATP-binding protein [Herbiconiux daphne]|uniref:ABC transporter ATP-binding protein n=1 Tax=Herbiconiux daphne TaxID=2970914 RepID=A0ABT2H0J6_9MICO|nr:ABC transporter ATP-binding protein [Herbiconiux daphne]MCS5733376.1 ABC transporter ATP-binding protein [Herbiconiux daphne]